MYNSLNSSDDVRVPISAKQFTSNTDLNVNQEDFPMLPGNISVCNSVFNPVFKPFVKPVRKSIFKPFQNWKLNISCQNSIVGV